MMVFLLTLALLFPSAFAADTWPQWSGDRWNHHNLTPATPRLSAQNVHLLKPSWVIETSSSVVETPTVADNTVYFTDIAKISVVGLFSGGYLYSADATTGHVKWSEKIGTYTKSGLRNFSRSSPAISGDKIVIGDSLNNLKFIARSLGAYVNMKGTSVLAINRHTGKLLWKTEVESHFASRITMSPVIYNNQVIVGVSSIESEIPAVRRQLYACCTFKGSLVSLDLNTGKILWKTKTISENLKEFSGAPVWGNSPPIDVKRNRIYIGTGNNYNPPKAMLACYINEKKLNQLPEEAIVKKCAAAHDSEENLFDSLIAIDLATGKIIWSRKTLVYDSWNVGCGSKFTSFPPRSERICPKPEGMDGDFAQAPMLIKNPITGEDVLVAGQKNGMFWSLRAEDGKVLWSKQIGPGGKLGGHQWGSATDGKTIFYQTTNLEHNEVTMEVGLFKGQKIKGGYWGALNLQNGELLWQTPDPSTKFPLLGEKINHLIYGKNLGRGYFAAAMGPLTYYNGMIFAGSLTGEMLALDSSSGKILWSFKAKGSVVSAPSIVNDQLFWGAGYHLGFEDNKLYSFSLK